MARTEVVPDSGKKPVRGRPFPKGHPKHGGRAKGTPNKLTRDVKEFFRELVSDPAVQAAVRRSITVDGEFRAFMAAADHVIGRAKETIEVNAPALSGLLKLAVSRQSTSASTETKERKVG